MINKTIEKEMSALVDTLFPTRNTMLSTIAWS